MTRQNIAAVLAAVVVAGCGGGGEDQPALSTALLDEADRVRALDAPGADHPAEGGFDLETDAPPVPRVDDDGAPIPFDRATVIAANALANQIERTNAALADLAAAAAADRAAIREDVAASAGRDEALRDEIAALRDEIVAGQIVAPHEMLPPDVAELYEPSDEWRIEIGRMSDEIAELARAAREYQEAVDEARQALPAISALAATHPEARDLAERVEGFVDAARPASAARPDSRPPGPEVALDYLEPGWALLSVDGSMLRVGVGKTAATGAGRLELVSTDVDGGAAVVAINGLRLALRLR